VAPVLVAVRRARWKGAGAAGCARAMAVARRRMMHAPQVPQLWPLPLAAAGTA